MAVRDYDPFELDVSQFEVVSEPDWSSQSLDTTNFELVSEPNDYRESGDALRLRQQAQREAEQEQDQSTYLERLALGAGQGVRGLQSGLGGLFNLFGLTDAGRAIQSNARAGQAELADTSATLAGQNPDLASEWVEQFGGMATQQVPSIAAAALSRGNRFAPAAVAGLQSAGQVQDAAEQAYEAQGMSPDEATSRARLPALTSGAITGALTALMPGGTERLAGMMFAGPTGVRAAREGVYGIAKRIFGEAAREAPEEMIDQLGQAAVAKFSYDPEKPLDEILMETWEAGGWGAGTAGAVGTLAYGMNAIDRATANMPEPQTGMNLRQPPSPPLPPLAPQLTQSDIDQANRVNAIAQLTAAENERLGQNAATFDPSEFELVEEPTNSSTTPPVLEQELSQVSQPEVTGQVDAETLSVIQKRLLASMQSRSMDLTPADFQRTEPTVQSILGPNAPTWQQLAEAGVVNASPNPDGTVNVRVDSRSKIIPPRVGTETIIKGRVYKPAIEMESGEVIVGNRHEEIIRPGYKRRGYVSPEGKFLSIMEVAREVQAAREEKSPITAPPVAANLATTETAPEPVKSDALRQYEGELAQFRQSSKDYQKARKNFQARKIDERSYRAAESAFDKATAKKDRAERTYQKALKDEARAGKPERKAPESKYERPPDIEDFLDGEKIRRVSPDDKSEYAELQRVAEGLASDFFTDDDNASPLDTAAQAVDLSPQELLDQLINLQPMRKAAKDAFYREQRFMDQDAAFQKVVVQNDARDKKNTTRVTTDGLNVGDKFRRQGENITAVKKGQDGVTFKDGQKFGTPTVPLGTSLHVQKGSLRRSSTGKQHGPSGETPPTGSQPPCDSPTSARSKRYAVYSRSQRSVFIGRCFHCSCST